jgi:hypothetical protein
LTANASSQAVAINLLNANVTAANVRISGLIGNAAGQSVQLQTLIDLNALGNVAFATIDANLGAFQTYTNSALSSTTLATVTDDLAANLGAFQTYANANISAITINVNAINSNLGAFQTYANANVGVLYDLIDLGNTAVQTLFDSIYSNANVSAYLLGDITIGNVTAGNVRSNGNIAMTSNIARNVYVNSYAPGPTQGNVGDIWYQTF